MIEFRTFDAAYVERLRCGDQSTANHFIAYFGELVRLKAARRVNSASAVDDICQETFARVLTSLKKENGLHHPERLGAFVTAVCQNVLREYRRSEARWTELPEDQESSGHASAAAVFEGIARDQQQEHVRRILDELPEKDRQIIRKVFLEERDKDEVCRDLGVTREYLRVMLFRAKQAFKTLYLRKMRAPLGDLQLAVAVAK
jgi:RNA polymerase sigma-70 factor (ECF subfamily)